MNDTNLQKLFYTYSQSRIFSGKMHVIKHSKMDNLKESHSKEPTNLDYIYFL